MLKKIILIIISILLYISCGAKETIIPKGHIIYSIAGTIYSVNLQSKKITPLYKEDDQISSIQYLGDNKFLLASEGTGIISILNLTTHKNKFLFKGSAVTYLPAFNTVLFSSEYANGLYINNLKNPVIMVLKKITDADQYDIKIPVSDHEIVFMKKEAERDSENWSYNITTNQLKLLPLQHCTFPKLWRNKTKQLICFDRGTDNYFLTSLDGKIKEKLPFKLYTAPVLYLPETDQLILSIATVRNWQ